MRVLLDTHAFLWFLVGDPRLSIDVRLLLEKEETELVISAASVWEMAIKSSMGKLLLPLPVADYIATKVRLGLLVLPIDWTHAAAVQELPWHHRDPFDRLIIAQAQIERLPLVSNDRMFRAYGVTLIW